MQDKGGRQMKRMRAWMNERSVKVKLICYGYLIIAPVLFFICAGLLLYNYQKELSGRFQNDLSSVTTLSESLNMLQTDIKDFSTYICINQEIHDLLSSNHVEELNEDARLWLDHAPMQVVQDMIALKGHIKTLAIYPENGIRPYLRGMDGSVHLQSMEEVKQTESYKETLASENGMLWKSVPRESRDTYISSTNDKVVLYREIFDLTQKKTLGYIVIGVSQEKFSELCGNILGGSDESVLVLDKNAGELVRAGKVPPEIEAFLKEEDFIHTDYRKRENHLTYGEYDIICCQMNKNASIVCKIVPRYELQMQFLDVAYMPLILLLGLLLGLLPLLFIISNLVTKPLRQVSEAIRKFSAGDFSQQVQVTTKDEVGEVADCFNKMVGDIRKLIDENYVIKLSEKESELAALQAQINPHFLYNTLDALYWQAMEAGNEELGETILALSDLFRLVLGKGKNEVTVGQEAELIARYLQIQKMRFSKRLQYEICIDEEIRQEKIPKLILQPFVENAIVHGFENVSTPCKLTVTGRRVDKKLVFEIRDTGIGMSREQLAALWEEESVNYSKQRIGRYAIKNIRERLQLKFHEQFTLEIQSGVGEGTTVILTLPCEEAVVCH